MKYLPLLWYGVWRKPFRTLLTFLSIGVAFLLFGLLHGVTFSARHYVTSSFRTVDRSAQPVLSFSAALFYTQHVDRLVVMPTYEYRCEANGKIVEVRHKMSEKISTWGELCSRAGISVGQTNPSAPVQKLISASFVGTGSAASTPACDAPGCGSGACGSGMCAFD